MRQQPIVSHYAV